MFMLDSNRPLSLIPASDIDRPMPAAHKPEYMEFVSRLRSARKAKRLSQRDLGAALGKPQSYVSKVETCERRLDLIETAEWCLALDIQLGDILPQRLRAAMGRTGHPKPDGIVGEDHNA